jgi:hypothetical protein
MKFILSFRELNSVVTTLYIIYAEAEFELQSFHLFILKDKIFSH